MRGNRLAFGMGKDATEDAINTLVRAELTRQYKQEHQHPLVSQRRKLRMFLGYSIKALMAARLFQNQMNDRQRSALAVAEKAVAEAVGPRVVAVSGRVFRVVNGTLEQVPPKER